MKALPLLALLSVPLAAQGIPTAPFEWRRLDDRYFSEGAAVGDFDQDGDLDVTSGPFWWEGPDFFDRHTIYAGQPSELTNFSPHFTSSVADVDSDGWPDVITTGLPGSAAYWYRNPGLSGGLWQQTLLFPSVGTETPTFHQLIPGGAPELICVVGFEFGFLEQDATDPFAPWNFRRVALSQVNLQYFHGIGAGDVDGDGLEDIMTGIGWFKQPPSLAGDPLWQGHFFPWGAIEGAQMLLYDVDGDGDNDMITGWDAHGYGLGWFENEPQATGDPVDWTPRLILSVDPNAPGVQFSQLHALKLADIDGDGLQDLVTGKTYLAHNGLDPGALDPAVLYWFRLDRSGGNVTYTPHRIDSDSGVGRDFAIADLNGDGRLDVVTGSKKGIYVFRRAGMWPDVYQLLATSGGNQNFAIDAGTAAGGGLYWVIGTLSGTWPGFFYRGVHVPINVDLYTSFTLANANLPGLLNQTFGALGPLGRASATITIPPGLPVSPPLTANYAAVFWDGQLNLLRASNGSPLTLF